MRLIKYRFQPEGDHLEVVAGGDLHIGHPCFSLKTANAHRDYILASPDRVTLDVGDPVENSLRDSVGSGVYEQTIRPRDQLKEAKAYYWDIAEQGKLLGICESNHPDRSVKVADFSPTEYLCEVLRTEFIRYQAILAITVGNSAKGYTYLIHCRHFAGGACTPEGIQRQLRLKSRHVQGCDAHVAGHCHCYTHETEVVRVPDSRHGKVREIERHYATCSSFMEWDESYAEMKSYDPPLFGMISLKLYRDERKVELNRLTY